MADGYSTINLRFSKERADTRAVSYAMVAFQSLDRKNFISHGWNAITMHSDR
jgi:hypothetical protein